MCFFLASKYTGRPGFRPLTSAQRRFLHRGPCDDTKVPTKLEMQVPLPVETIRKATAGRWLLVWGWLDLPQPGNDSRSELERSTIFLRQIN